MTENKCQCLTKRAGAGKFHPLILVHCGAGEVPDDRVPGRINGVKAAVRAALSSLAKDGTAVDAVEAAIRSMEEDVNLNAGHGAVLTIEGNVEMSASIMSGDLHAGAVGCMRNVLHPISVARCVMEKTPHVLLVDDGALRFAEKQGFEILAEGALATDSVKKSLAKYKEIVSQTKKTHVDLDGGTVGAVALDKCGRLAAATSTGGLTGKYHGRVGDSAQLGGGTYADDTLGAVSMTGHGESILKLCVGHSILMRLQTDKNPKEAAQFCIDGMTKRLNNTAGSIVITPTGDIGIYHSTKRMPWAYCKVEEGLIKYGVEHDKCEQEPANIGNNNIC